MAIYDVTSNSYSDPMGNPVGGLFTTSADTYANSFMGPQSPMFNNPGWGVDPNLMTPSYAAPYRPQYGGYGAYYNNTNPGVFRSAGHLLNPFGKVPLWQSPGQEADPYLESLGYKPSDMMMTGLSRYVIPGVGLGAAMKYLGPNTNSITGDIAGSFTGKGVAASFGRSTGRTLSQGVVRGLGGSKSYYDAARAFEASSAARASAHATMMAGQAARAGVGSGFVNFAERAAFRAGSVFTGARAAYAAGGLAGVASMGAVGMAGVAGSAIGVFALPMLAAEGGAFMFDSMVADPYVNTRKTARDLRENFANVSFADMSGSTTRSGMGLSHVESNRMARDITRRGLRDFVFNGEEYSEIANMSVKAGLLDGTKGQDISKKIKSIAEQIKLVISVSQDPSVQNAIEELSKLHMAGADLGGGRFGAAGTAYSRMGAYAAAAGTSVQRLMDRVGQQGQMLYQMNGMTPYLGQLAAGNLYAGFASGQRTGLISQAQLARMGGLEGATQASMTGSINALQTPYARMLMMNHYFGGSGGAAGPGGGQSITNVVSHFGQYVAQDPTSAMGMQILYGNRLAGKFHQDFGDSEIENMAVAVLKNNGIRPGADGKYAPHQLAVALKQFGMSDSEITAFIEGRRTAYDPEASKQRSEAMYRKAIENTKTYMDNEGLLNTKLSGAKHRMVGGWNSTKGAVYNLVEGLTAADSWLVDKTGTAWNNLFYGSTFEDAKNNPTAEQVFGTSVDNLYAAGFVNTTKKDDDGKLIYEADFKGFNSRKIGSKRSLWDTLTYKSDSISQQDSSKIISTIEKIAREDVAGPSGDLARKFMRSSDPEERKKILSQIMRSNRKDFGEELFDKMMTNGYNSRKGVDNMSQLMSDIEGAQTETFNISVTGDSANGFKDAVDKSLGVENDLNTFDDLRALGSINNLAQMSAAKDGGLSHAEIDEYIAKDPLLKKLVGDRRGNAAVDFLEKAYNAAGNKGLLVKASMAYEMGDISSNRRDPRNISNPKYRSRFMAAKSDEERSNILSEYLVSISGGKAYEKTIQGDNLSLVERANSMKELFDVSKTVAKDNAAAAASAVNYNDPASKMMASMDKFDRSVSVFQKAVEQFSGEKVRNDPTQPNESGQGAGHYLRQIGKNLNPFS